MKGGSPLLVEHLPLCRSLPWSPPHPVPEGEGKQGRELADQQQEMEASVQEQPLGEKAPIHCPLKEELPPKVEGPDHIATGVGEEEGEAQDQLWVGGQA